MLEFWIGALPWADATWWVEIVSRTVPAGSAWSSVVPSAGEVFRPSPLPLWLVWAAVGVGVLAVVVGPLWRATRIMVTLVHELGHAGIGILMGRRFTGFVVRADMSGHAVTVGKTRGFGLALTTWAGYPMPAAVALGLVWTAQTGWAPAVLLGVAVVCLVCLVFVRSWSTAGTLLVVGAASGALWWWRDDARSAAVLLAVALVLLLGAWRHVFAVARVPSGSDPDVMGSLTWLPGWFWVGTQMLAIGAATYGVVLLLLPVLMG